MKKSLLTLALTLLTTLGISAKNYTDTLVVTVNGTSTRQTATISVDKNDDGTYNFNMKNFMLKMGGQTMGIGNITLNNLQAATSSKGDVVSTHQDIAITAGDDPKVDKWMGTMLGTIPLDLKLLVNDEKLYTLIDIDMQKTLGQTIHVTFGDNYQLPNSGFEDFHTATLVSPEDPNTTCNGDEPNAWHSFQSATGTQPWVWLAGGGSSYLYKSTEVRPGSTSKQSALLTSHNMIFVIANGTMTTGRLSAGSMTATDPSNHSQLDMSSTDKDGNGDPFYTLMDGTPDSIAVWVKFKQKTPVADHPYASISAAITDGTYYQDPQVAGKTYNNVVATAKNAKIESKGFVWQRVTAPFVYTDNNVNGKAILVTISTNADPGKGSTDSLYVDDISLVYGIEKPALSVDGKNVELSSSELTVKTADIANAVITPTTSNHGSFTAMNTISSDDTQKTVRILYCADDLSSVKEYTLTLVKDGTTGINSIADKKDGSAELYNLAGQRINNAQPGQVVIVKKGGKAVKVMK